MKNIEDIIKTILADYVPDVRYLQEAKVLHDDPLEIAGIFNVENSNHLVGKLEHLAISETCLCVNQIERVLAAYLVEDGFVEEWGPLDFTKWNPSLLGNEGLVIVYEEINFRKPINPGKFIGTIKMEDWTISGRGNYHVQLGFNLANHAHYGGLRICFVPSMAEKINIDELK